MKYILFTIVFFFYSDLWGQEFHIDPGHTFIRFSVERFGAVHVSGRFNTFSGIINYNPEEKSISDATVSIEAGSIDTGHDVRDGHLKGEMWLNAEAYPEINFSTTSITRSDEGFVANGQLSINGVTQDVQFPFQMNGPAVDPTKSNAIGISGVLMINRQDYGITFSKLLDNGKLFIGNEVKIRIDALAVVKK